jgi:energy-coupling factor transporter ATP-binding protein EcfA2
MARPTALFVDEPTSGLDASSALLVMQSLQQLVSREGVTVCSVIHQPRKFIFDLFDSLILLGTGGRMVFHGPVSTCMDYFLDLGYVLPPGESTADWLIDISTGRIAVDQRCEDSSPLEEQTIASGLRLAYRIERINGEGEHATGPPVPHPLAHKPSFGMPARASVNQRKIPPPRPPRKKRSSLSVAMLNNNGASFHRAREPILRDKHSFTRDGPSSRKRMKVDNEAKLRREMLYRNWDSHYRALDRKRKKIFEPPQPFPHPPLITRPSFLRQLHLQLQRMFLLAWRNRTTKLIDITIIIGAIALITLFEGTTLPTKEKDPPIPFDILIAPKKAQLEYGLFFPYLFGFATEGSKTFVRYGLSVGVIGAVLIGLTAVKSLTDKRQEFFREAGKRTGCS